MDGTLRATTTGDGAEIMSWRVTGMDCGACVSKLETAVRRLPGITDVRVNLMAETLTLSRAVDGTEAEAVERQVAALGYRASRIGEVAAPPAATDAGGCRDGDHGGKAPEHLPHAHARDAADVPWWRSAKAYVVAALGVLVGLAWVFSVAFPRQGYWIYPAATVVAVVPFARRAVALARAGSPFSIETLMCVAALGAVAIGAAHEAAVVVLLFAVGELLENVAAGRARAGIRALAGLIPRTARREGAGGAVAEIPAERLAIGDIVQIRPGDRVPSDGMIIEGTSALDESPVTGESVPVPRGPGEAVLAGSVNADAGLLRVRTTRGASDNTVARIVRLVEEAAASRAPTQRFVERFAEWWTPAAMIAAVVVILVPPVLFGGDWLTWTYRGLALLLIACPCALVISVPAAVASGLSAGARFGLLAKGGAVLEAIGAVRTVAFDKTGTLTRGYPQVTDVVPLAAGSDERSLLQLAAAVEQGSSHPLGRAILERAATMGIALPETTNAHAVPGRAAQATVEGRLVGVGSPRHAAAGVGLGADAGQAESLEADGKTVVVVLADGVILGLIALRDEPRADAIEGIAALKRMGVDVMMLTGDNERTGRAIAARLGLEVRAQLLPEDKLKEIARLKARGTVVMVGDGINDAPALAAASVGVAMGGGADVALETADAALLHERVAGVAGLVDLSRSTLANIRQNVGVALGLKVVFLVTTLAGITGLWPAILADTGATVLVTLNALRLLRWVPAVQGVSLTNRP
ncbi:MAG TPA: heavy metal translocating P-type ATPase [Rhodopila sp.]